MSWFFKSFANLPLPKRIENVAIVSQKKIFRIYLNKNINYLKKLIKKKIFKKILYEINIFST